MYPQAVSAGMVVVVGAGPCGLATARELVALGHPRICVLEAARFPGGLAASFVDDAGFTWDRGGHVVFSHYGEFDRLLDDTMGDEVERHDRSSFVHVDGRWVPYPFQNNLRHLGPERAAEALTDLIDAAHRPGVPRDSSFAVWMERQFGATICELFMRPYNAKVWATPPELMSSSWMAERVPTVDWRRALANLTLGNDDLAWGPNNRFVFPASGGTGAIYERAAANLGDVVRLGSAVSAIDARKHELVTSGGETIVYDQLVWTGALDVLVSLIDHVPQDLIDAAGQLVSNSVTVVGMGYETPLVDDRSWLYFPDDDVPFYRATNFAKYAPANVPGGRTEQYCSWMTEIASSPHRPLEPDGLTERVDAALRRLRLVPQDAHIASVHVDHIERAYPVPTLGRDAALAVIHPWLEKHDIFSRGRFGAWRYELGNMDHAVKMGVDIARRLVRGTPEEAWA